MIINDTPAEFPVWRATAFDAPPGQCDCADTQKGRRFNDSEEDR
jgi:hypothetical protein